MSNLHNVSSAALADEFGNIKAQIDALTGRADVLKAELIERGDERIEGPRFTVTVSKSTRTTYDDKAIREALGADIVKSYERNTETTTVRVKATAIFGRAA